MVDGETLATAPVLLICLVDHDTYIPVPNEAVNMANEFLWSAYPARRSGAAKRAWNLLALDISAFDTKYISVEERSKHKGE